jgi:hypothetical protein
VWDVTGRGMQMQDALEEISVDKGVQYVTLLVTGFPYQ